MSSCSERLADWAGGLTYEQLPADVVARLQQGRLDGAILISREGIAEAACVYLDVPADGVTLSKGFGSRHLAAAAISKKTNAVAFCVSQSSGTTRVFQHGEERLRIEPLDRPHVWQPLKLEAQEDE